MRNYHDVLMLGSQRIPQSFLAHIDPNYQHKEYSGTQAMSYCLDNNVGLTQSKSFTLAAGSDYSPFFDEFSSPLGNQCCDRSPTNFRRRYDIWSSAEHGPMDHEFIVYHPEYHVFEELNSMDARNSFSQGRTTNEHMLSANQGIDQAQVLDFHVISQENSDDTEAVSHALLFRMAESRCF